MWPAASVSQKTDFLALFLLCLFCLYHTYNSFKNYHGIFGVDCLCPQDLPGQTWVPDRCPSSFEMNLLLYPEVCVNEDPFIIYTSLLLPDNAAQRIEWQSGGYFAHSLFPYICSPFQDKRDRRRGADSHQSQHRAARGRQRVTWER